MATKMKYITIIFLFAACSKPPETHCYHCQSEQMPDITFCGITETEMQTVIAWRAEWVRDTLVCKKVEGCDLPEMP